MTTRHLLIAAGTAFVLGLFAQAPAAVIYGWVFARQPDTPVRLFGIEGTIVSGSARYVMHGGQPLLTDLHWSLQPWALLLGRLGYHVRTTSTPLLLDGRLGIGFGGTHIDALKASGELGALAAAAGQSFVPFVGQAGIDVHTLRLRDGWPVTATGQLRVIGLHWTLARQPILLGDYQADLGTESGEITALIHTLSGVLDVSGDARLKPDRSYELNLQLRPRPDAPPMVANLLRSVGAPDAQGYYRLRRTGKMTP
ncbi:type II secretion system protein N (GspN) [Fontimonas thermophila]|uniref:Type II secretion system protein N n=1 Tax=Fontimonas thermophila TaxID=1076937 RepID=A0A1I2HVJ7_9GAMM|nr:type II secretion system protein N [Fontimonas thermophila]SFF32391.1 type II secretion system protein N (GspN) [Fontimonas thermophila]